MVLWSLEDQKQGIMSVLNDIHKLARELLGWVLTPSQDVIQT